MASTIFSFQGEGADGAAEDSGSDHEHWPEDFKPRATPDGVSPGYDSHNGVRMHTYVPAAPSTRADSPPPPPSPKEESVKAAVLTELPVQYIYATPDNMHTHAYVPAAAATTVTYAAVAPPPPAHKPAEPKAVDPAPVSNTYTYHPSFSEKPAETTYKWQGRTKAEVEEDNLKIAEDEKVWEKRKVIPAGLAPDQMIWVVEVDGSYTLR
jgi:hypothetical protein